MNEVKIDIVDLDKVGCTHVYNVLKYPDLSGEINSNIEFLFREYALKSLVLMNQSHSNLVKSIDHNRDRIVTVDADGVTTQFQEMTLGVQTADCVPLILYSRDQIAAVHCGWRGTLDDIIEVAIRTFSSDISSIRAFIGPAIQVDSYEVKTDFYELFVNKCSGSETFFEKGQRDQYFFDLPGYVEYRLRNIGLIKIDNIGEDTLSEESKYPSYRRSICQGAPTPKRILTLVTILDQYR